MYHSGNQLIDPYLLLEKAQAREGMHIADLGCGHIGHIVFPGATIAGERGAVYAVDVLKDALQDIKRRAELENLLNVHTVWSNLEKIGQTAIPGKGLDIAFVVNVLSQSKEPYAILAEAKRLLKEKGRLVVVDWFKKGLSFAPPEERYVDFGKLKEWARANEFTMQEEFSAGPYHYGVVLYKYT